MRLRTWNSPAIPTATASGLSAFTSRHAPGWRMARRQDPWHKLILVLAGGCELELSTGPILLEEGDLVLVASGTAHRLIDDPQRRAAFAGICLDPQRCQAVAPELVSELAAAPVRRLAVSAAQREGCLRLIGTMLARRRSGGAAPGLFIWAEVLALLAEVMRASARSAAATQRPRHSLAAALAWLDQHVHEPLTVAEVAARSGLGIRAFTTRFRQHTGETVIERVVRLRLARAVVLLASGLPVTAAALGAGFGDLSGFYRHFRRHYGHTPQRYRQRHDAAPG